MNQPQCENRQPSKPYHNQTLHLSCTEFLLLHDGLKKEKNVFVFFFSHRLPFCMLQTTTITSWWQTWSLWGPMWMRQTIQGSPVSTSVLKKATSEFWRWESCFPVYGSRCVCDRINIKNVPPNLQSFNEQTKWLTYLLKDIFVYFLIRKSKSVSIAQKWSSLSYCSCNKPIAQTRLATI